MNPTTTNDMMTSQYDTALTERMYDATTTMAMPTVMMHDMSCSNHSKQDNGVNTASRLEL